MSQQTPVIAVDQTGTDYRTQDNAGKTALMDHHKGSAAPSYKAAGMIWLDDAATPWVLKIYDGTDWITLGTVNATSNAHIPYISGSSLQTVLDDLKTTECITIAASDETTAITTGTGKVTFRMPYAFTLSSVKASVTTAPTGSTIIIDINEAGTTVLSTKLTIDATEKTSATAAVPAVISDTALAADAEITIDFDQVGSTIAGAGVKVYLIGKRA